MILDSHVLYITSIKGSLVTDSAYSVTHWNQVLMMPRKSCESHSINLASLQYVFFTHMEFLSTKWDHNQNAETVENAVSKINGNRRMFGVEFCPPSPIF